MLVCKWWTSFNQIPLEFRLWRNTFCKLLFHYKNCIINASYLCKPFSPAEAHPLYPHTHGASHCPQLQGSVWKTLASPNPLHAEERRFWTLHLNPPGKDMGEPGDNSHRFPPARWQPPQRPWRPGTCQLSSSSRSWWHKRRVTLNQFHTDELS